MKNSINLTAVDEHLADVAEEVRIAAQLLNNAPPAVRRRAPRNAPVKSTNGSGNRAGNGSRNGNLKRR